MTGQDNRGSMYSQWPDNPQQTLPARPYTGGNPPLGRHHSYAGQQISSEPSVRAGHNGKKPGKRKKHGGEPEVSGGQPGFPAVQPSLLLGVEPASYAAQPGYAGMELLVPGSLEPSSGVMRDDRAWTMAISGSFNPATTIQQNLMADILRGRSPDVLTAYPSLGPTPHRPLSAQTSPTPSHVLPSHGPSPSFSASPVMYRSWTLDSAARSSLLPYEPTHQNRNLSRSPLLRQVSPSQSQYSGESGARREREERRGPPPKAILGGPGGKTYDELRAGSSRIVSAPSRTPPQPQTTKLAQPDSRTDAEGRPAMWKSRPVDVRLPVPAAQSADSPAQPSFELDQEETSESAAVPPTSSLKGSIDHGEVDAAHSASTADEKQLDSGRLTVAKPTGTAPEQGQEGGKPMVNGKEVVVSMPQANGWQMLSGAQHPAGRSEGDMEDPEPDGDRFGEVHTWRLAAAKSYGQLSHTHGRDGSIGDLDDQPFQRKRERDSNSLGNPFQPRHSPMGSIAAQIGHYESASSRPGQLRPMAPPFEPDFATRRIVSLPQASSPAHASLRGKRSVSDFGRGASSKRLRPDAVPFQPNGSGYASSASSASPQKKTIMELENVPDAAVPIQSTWAANDVAPANASIRNGSTWRMPTFTPLKTGQRDSSASPQSSGMKRSISGRLRPAAPSFVPTGSFTFRPASDCQVQSQTSNREAGGGYLEGIARESASSHEAPVEPTRPREPRGSPAAVLHDLSLDDHCGAAEGTDLSPNSGGSGSQPGEDKALAGSGAGPEIGADSHQGLSHSKPMTSLARAHSPTGSFGLPSPNIPDEADGLETARFAPRDSNRADYFGEFNDVFTDHPPPPNGLGLGLGNSIDVRTPIESAPPTHRGSTTEPYETVDGSPLIPRRHLETPATPVKDIAVESQIPVMVSPTPARRHRSRPSLLEENDDSDTVSSRTTEDDLVASRTSLAPVFEQPEIRVDGGSDDRRFRHWTYPSSPDQRPPVVRRFTFPVPDGQSSLAGIASTLPNKTPPDPSMPFEQDDSRLSAVNKGDIPPLSTRTSVEFPLRPVDKVLKVANAVPGEPADAAAMPGASEQPDDPATSTENGGLLPEQRLERLESLLQSLHIRLSSAKYDATLQDFSTGVSIASLGEQLSGMIAEMRSSIEDRLRLPSPPSSEESALQVANEQQVIMLAELLQIARQPIKPVMAGETTGDIKHIRAELSSLATEQAALQAGITRTFSRDVAAQGQRLQAAIEALDSLRADAELRRASDDKKDEVINQLRQQVVEGHGNLSRIAEERDKLVAKVAKAEEREAVSDESARDLRIRLSESQSGAEAAATQTAESQATIMALRAERDGLAAGLRESFALRKADRTEIEEVRNELTLERHRTSIEAHGSAVSFDKLDQITQSIKTLQADVLAKVAALGADSKRTDGLRDEAIEGLKEDKRALQAELAELRKKTYESASKIADADLRLAMAINDASRMESTLRSSLSTAEQGKLKAERRSAELQSAMEVLRVEKSNMSAIATERSGAMRIMEIRHQALVQENVFWREFALSYDRREYRKYTQSQSFRRPASPAPAPGPPGHPESETVIPSSEPQTPTMLHNTDGSGADQTPELTMSTSTSCREDVGGKA